MCSGPPSEPSSPTLDSSTVRAVAVVVGGAVGALARWGIGLAFAGTEASFPWATFLVNITGAFGLAATAVLLSERLRPTRYVRSLLGIGSSALYTTFSTMAVEGVKLIDTGHVRTALVYWLATLVAGQAAGVYGTRAGRFGPARPRERTDEARRRVHVVADLHRGIGYLAAQAVVRGDSFASRASEGLRERRSNLGDRRVRR